MMFNRRDPIEDLDFTVQIYESELERIKRNLLNSDIEEGGKLLGNIIQNGNSVSINIESYIDSGPQVDNSAVHLHPDGHYQEAMFRVLERFDDGIDHIGSWHSHHCNGLPQLSTGDINGYAKDVNNYNYRPNIFVAILVTKTSYSAFDYKAFLFFKNVRMYKEVEKEKINVVHGTYPYNEILLSLENISLKHRKLTNPRETIQPKPIREVSGEDVIKEIRIEDNKWLKD